MLTYVLIYLTCLVMSFVVLNEKIISNELERMLNKAVAQLDVLSWHLPGRTAENKKPVTTSVSQTKHSSNG
jgi:hypothetical protein